MSLIQPYAPHVAEELWSRLGHERLWEAPWPVADPALLEVETVEVVVQVNGKIRDRLHVSPATREDELVALARASERVQAHLDGGEVARTVVVPGKLVNFVTLGVAPSSATTPRSASSRSREPPVITRGDDRRRADRRLALDRARRRVPLARRARAGRPAARARRRGARAEVAAVPLEPVADDSVASGHSWSTSSARCAGRVSTGFATALASRTRSVVPAAPRGAPTSRP